MTGNLLVVDWDYFFPSPDPGDDDWEYFDWAHRESTFFIEGVWPSRAQSFLANGRQLPGLVDGPGWATPAGFWDRVDLEDGAHLIVVESNARALLAGSGFDHVWLFDAHHDCGYTKGPDAATALALRGSDPGAFWQCGDWMVPLHAAGADLHVRYPTWRTQAMTIEPEPVVEVDRAFDDGTRPPVAFDTVVVCRSGAWVPPWHDQAFIGFVDAAPVDTIEVPEDAIDPMTPRPFDGDLARSLAEQTRELMAAMEERG
ncbi:hypothetical protein DVS28_b0157 (plasmid) [Euzebya pacifica]|uniref:Uncharacterized protein n=1 Tax=Euzebya pacifica TaxID=1608957 RepID=A0A346Y630_9ACTN|nr:hypothetical protein [Euzebya pacifica]AXV09927.1 hypothetical protein DVS28_b0157 [Euzebya pacifica]